MYLKNTQKLRLFVKKIFNRISNLWYLLFISGGVFVLICELKKKYLSQKKVMSIYCHGNRLVYASLFGLERGKRLQFPLKIPHSFPLGDWDLFWAFGLVLMLFEQHGAIFVFKSVPQSCYEMPTTKFASQRRKKRKFYGNRFTK